MTIKTALFCFGAMCSVGCGLNVWCMVTHQPSVLHLNVSAAVLSAIAAIVTLTLAVVE